jgi:hypothetical protein
MGNRFLDLGRAVWRHTPWARLRRIEALLLEAEQRQKREDRFRRRTRQQLDALMRHVALPQTGLAAAGNVNARRFRLYSQNEEDGITLALLAAAGITTRTFVEIGSGQSGGNSAVLALELGWSGLMVEGHRPHVRKLRPLMASNPGVAIACEYVTSAGFNALLKTHGFKGEIDFLSIDIDSIDYWLLDALKQVSPRVLVMEYNAHFGPRRAVTLPDAAPPSPRPKGYFGASLAALEKRARGKGYRLVLCEESGVNAYFLRNDVAPEIPGLTAAAAYRPAVDATDYLEGDAKAIDIYGVIEQRGLPLISV